jgi:hypothetical protein
MFQITQWIQTQNKLENNNNNYNNNNNNNNNNKIG